MIVIPSFRGLVARVFATSASGFLYAWGENRGYFGVPFSGQLGIGSTASPSGRSSPVLLNSSTGFVGAVSGWTKISSGDKHSLGINSGKLYAWGGNGSGQLGIGSVTVSTLINYNKSSPVQVGSDSNWISVSSGNRHSLALKSDGTLWSWGYNSDGQLGLGDYGNYAHRSSPVQVGSLTNWSSISAGWNHSLAIRTDGSLWAWGVNSFGQLGDSSFDPRNYPVKVGTITSWAMVSAGRYHSLGIRTDGTLWAWGANSFGQLGDYSNSNRNSPVPITEHTNWSLVSAGGYHSLAIRNAGASGTLWAWGRNDYGQVGKPGIPPYYMYYNYNSPVQIGGSGWLKASAGHKHSGAINSSEKLFFWGFNNKGQIGNINSSFNKYPSPIAIMSSINWFDLASMKDNSSFAIKKQ